MTPREHRYVRYHEVDAYLAVGWLALPTLNGTTHGQWSVHCVWLCDCRPALPKREAA